MVNTVTPTLAGCRKPDGPLTHAERNAEIEAWLAVYPRPVALLKHAFRGAYRMAKFHGLDDDEINTLCLYGAVRAARLFDPARGMAFSSYVGRSLRNAVMGHLYAHQRDHEEREGRPLTSLSAPAGESGRTAADMVPDHRPSERPTDLEAVVGRLIDRRVPGPPSHKLALRLRWGVGCREHTLREAGQVVGLTKERVRQIELRAARLVRDELAALGLAPEGLAPEGESR